jgi:diguanylate cyclase
MTTTYLHAMAYSLGLMALLVLVLSELEKRIGGRPLMRQAFIGLLFGAGAALSMADPITVAPGVLADLRSVMITLAGPFGGPLSVVIAAAVAVATRLSIGGAGALAGVLGVGFAAAVGLGAALLFRGRDWRAHPLALVVLGLASNAVLLPIFLAPSFPRGDFLANAALPVALGNFIGVLLLGSFLAREHGRLSAEAAMEQAALTDVLTGLDNRRSFDRQLERALASGRRRGKPVSVLLIDADHFKRINDEYGHGVGDVVLAHVAEAIRTRVRTSDVAARYGGEEFAVVLPDTDERNATLVGEQLRRALGSALVPTAAGQLSLTVSIGVAGGLGVSAARLVERADAALYAAKAAGRNRVVRASRDLAVAA